MRFSLLVAALVLVSGCDFQPTLDIETPEYHPALALTAILFADSTARIRVTESRDPYAPRPGSRRTKYAVLTTATVTLARDGGPSETLAFRSRPCSPGLVGYDGADVGECGDYTSAAPLQGGATYTVRAEAPGAPPATATVTIPARVSMTATRERGTPSSGLDTDRLTIRFRDMPGRGQFYALDALLGNEVTRGRVCTRTPPVTCRDTTYTSPYVRQTSFSTQDPVLIVGLRGVPGNTNVVTFTDELFDGQERPFTIEALVYGGGGDEVRPAKRTVRLTSITEALYDAYQQAYYSLGEENPFQEPSDLPSNVTGGYGLVGAAAVTEVVFP